jgi:quinol monooxygenase YgiN
MYWSLNDGKTATRELIMGRFVIVAYTPKAGNDQQLLAAVKKHLQVLRNEQFVTDKPAYVMRAADGSIIEVFEWRSAEAIQQAHSNPAIQALWAEFGAACDYTPLSKLAETHQMFAEFDAVQL